ncbi:DUF1800 domain-containing protein [Flavobacterium psychrophilum]|uniref:DUF1800 domain-containing protein n=1 Tax=Flavobacterium psychrophilum TaxID=96345 RepID=UPI00073E2F39|nr:DUF1800 domain-containing protein [Flavobacterium psychrophilum]MCB6230201.1 DUF1800 domain-containing protein [Flavobacterium psychrophilum]MEB3379084.1 DUF1800 domain-containing protein [Flavobacterium psychrophilum]OUD28172.1 hypothetical protein FPG92_04225 [Flavobacterium psychrophilum]QZL00623.1 DUF1800 domain-containing protein [Flavobacterium psychrophilum]SNB04453.1 conserved hypothetical protein [Flavobacterium psychrophilum]
MINNNTLWSLRLGFSNEQAKNILGLGLQKFLEKSFQAKYDSQIPSFLDESPKSLTALRDIRQKIKSDPESTKEIRKKEEQVSNEMKAWWIKKMMTHEFPLQEKMTCFWHNHFVATYQKVKVNYWVFQHNQLLRENAFGNFKELTKKVLKSNAMVRYLDNVDNRKDKLNENLSRELLELFTLGIGNYTESDIKNGAKALAGLGIGENQAQYHSNFEDHDAITYLGRTGQFKADDLVDIIFEQKNTPYFITQKILKWFIYDNPSTELVTYYGDYFKKMNFEIKPLLTKIFTEEFTKKTAGSKIKNPLEYSLQLISELQIELENPKVLVFFLKDQGMDLLNQPNVKGWVGGNSWLTSQVYLQRNNVANLFCSGRTINRKMFKVEEKDNEVLFQKINIKLDWNKNGNNKQIITELKNRLLFEVDDNTQQDFEKILKYDFDSTTEGSENAVLRLFNAMVKTPEYQLI